MRRTILWLYSKTPPQQSGKSHSACLLEKGMSSNERGIHIEMIPADSNSLLVKKRRSFSSNSGIDGVSCVSPGKVKSSEKGREEMR